jgi:alpha-beta hydrolase superfamily lysophospholipase
VEDFTTSDGYHCRYRRYRPKKKPPRAEIVCIHGVQSHAGWYEYSCTRLTEEGFSVSFLDRRGSGLNEEARGDMPSFRRLLDDLAEFLRPLRTDSLRPVFLLAISWGGKLAVALQRRHPGLVDGLILVCPGFFARVRPPLKQRLTLVWDRLTAPRWLVQVPLDDPTLFTASPQWQEFIRNDPLATHQATARFLVESVRLDFYLRLTPSRVTVPVLLLLAGQDRIIYNEPTREFVERFASKDKELIEYPEAHHTLEFEPNPDKYLTDVLHWLRKHCPG